MKYRGEEKLLAPILAATSYLVSIYTNYVGPYPAKSGLPEWTIGLSAVFLRIPGANRRFFVMTYGGSLQLASPKRTHICKT